ncbi:MAG: cobalamin-dependent protein, partial [Spirochaetia bacterium]|nr:cobalamin-dependent protein [Spirochaetia bacterium]
MNIVFACVHIQPSSRAVPLGAASVAVNAVKHFPHVVTAAVADCYLSEPLEQQLGKILVGKPDCVGLSIYLWNREVSLAIADGVKKALPACVIMVGGPEPTARPEFYQQENSIDYVFAGGAEEQIIP